MPKIVILDAYVANPGDLSWDALRAIGELEVYEDSSTEQIVERMGTAEIMLTSKCQISAAILKQLPHLKFIAVLATGYNNIDVAYAKQQGILISNAVGYGTSAVAQHVFALMLQFCNQVNLHHQSVQAGEWSANPNWCYWKSPLTELSGKTMGIMGLGAIGTAVAKIALAFGMKVIATKKNPSNNTLEKVVLVSTDTLFQESDFLSLHTPLNTETEGIINASNLAKMKATAYLINTGRGGLVNELDLRKVLLANQIAGAALDVLSKEPPIINHPLFGLSNCIITPHNAWVATESRARLIQIVVANINAFLLGKPEHLV